jgi:hypothetical protein
MLTHTDKHTHTAPRRKGDDAAVPTDLPICTAHGACPPDMAAVDVETFGLRPGARAQRACVPSSETAAWSGGMSSGGARSPWASLNKRRRTSHHMPQLAVNASGERLYEWEELIRTRQASLTALC